MIYILQSWGPSYNFSIWYVGLEGDDSVDLIKSSEDWHHQVSRSFVIVLTHLELTYPNLNIKAIS